MAKGKKGKKGGKKSKKNVRNPHMSEEMWKLVNNIPDLLLNFQDKPSQTSLFRLSRSKAAFYLWQLALKGKKKRGELVQGGVLMSALAAIEMPPREEEVQVRAPTIGLISTLCVDEAARVTVMGYRNAAVVNQLMTNLSFCTPCTVTSAARALAVLAKEETDAFLRAATSLDPIAKCLNEDNMLAARAEAASCLATCLKAYLAKNPHFTPQLYQSLHKKQLMVLRARLCQESGLSAMHALAKEKAAICLFYLTQQNTKLKQMLEQLKGIEALAAVLVDPYCALIGKAHAAGALYNLLTPDLKPLKSSQPPPSHHRTPSASASAMIQGGGQSGSMQASEAAPGSSDPAEHNNHPDHNILNESMASTSGMLNASMNQLSLREEVTRFEELVFSREQKEARQSTVEKLVESELILPLLHLCCGPEGPPKQVNRAQSAPASQETKSSSKSKGKKKGKKKKKGERETQEKDLPARVYRRK